MNSTFISNYRYKALLMQQSPTWHTAPASRTGAKVSQPAPGICLRLAAVTTLPQKQGCQSCCRAEMQCGEGRSDGSPGRDPRWPLLDDYREQMDTRLTCCHMLLKLQQPLKPSQPLFHCSSHVLTSYLERPRAEGTEG